MAEVVPIREEPADSPKGEVATTVSMQIDVGGANIGFTTWVARDGPVEDLKEVIGKLFDVAEYHRARFTLRTLEAQLKTAEKDFERIRSDRDKYLEDCRQKWFDGQRYGDLEMSGSQAAHFDTLDKAVTSRVEAIKELRHSISVTKGVLEGVQ